MANLSLTANLPVIFLREGKRFIAYTPALDLSTSGKSFAEAKRRFEEIAQVFFDEIGRMGTLEEVLLNLGWQKEERKFIPPTVVAHESQRVRILIPA